MGGYSPAMCCLSTNYTTIYCQTQEAKQLSTPNNTLVTKTQNNCFYLCRQQTAPYPSRKVWKKAWGELMPSQQGDRLKMRVIQACLHSVCGRPHCRNNQRKHTINVPSFHCLQTSLLHSYQQLHHVHVNKIKWIELVRPIKSAHPPHLQIMVQPEGCV